MTTQAQSMAAQENREVAPRVNQNVSNMASRLRDFSRMYPPMFFGYKVNEDSQDSLGEVYNIFDVMGVSSNEKAELAISQLKDVAQTWYTQWKDNRVLRAGPISWEVFRRAFLDRFFSREKRDAKVEYFINLCQGGMSVQ